MKMSDTDAMQMQAVEEEEETLQPKIRKQPVEEEEESLQMKPTIQKSTNGDQYATPEIGHKLNTTKGSGEALPNEVGAEMGLKIGADFSNVNVHADSQSMQLNRELGAQAFTHGNDIYFNRGKYNPHSYSGKRLMAHELTHVVQQGGAPDKIQGDFKVAPISSNFSKDISKIQLQIIQCTLQGTSRYSTPQPDPNGLVARIYFPTNITTLDDQDREVLARVVDHYRILFLGNSIHFDVVGTADWRPADNSRLARERAESVRQYLDNAFLRNSAGYSCSSSGIGTIGTPEDGRTAEELSEFRRADIITMFRHIRRDPDPPPTSDPPEPVLSTSFKARVIGSAGGGVVIGVGYGGLEIVDTTNNRRMYYRYAGLGVSAGLSGASGISDWIEFTTTAPIRVEDFEGPVFHTAGGVALGRGPMIETFRIFGQIGRAHV